jgi:hypothetical protein
MAIWQYDIYLIPRTKLNDLYDEIPDHIDLQMFDEVDWWRGHQPASDVKELINRCLTPNTDENPLPGCQEWGTEDSNRISVGFEGEDISWIWIRVDVRSKYDSLVSCIVELAKALDCLMLLTEEMVLIHPDRTNLCMHLRSSRAGRLFAN